jgi:uncharacterized protein
MTTGVRKDPANTRYCIEVDGHLCVLDYILENGTITFTHTGVPDAVGGRGIAAALTRFGLNEARKEGWKVVPLCSYTAAYLKRHTEFLDLVK